MAKSSARRSRAVLRCGVLERNERLCVDSLVARYPGPTALIAVVGLGYVGLPLVRALLGARFRVTGLDIDARKIQALKQGEAYISHSPAQVFTNAIAEGRSNPPT